MIFEALVAVLVLAALYLWFLNRRLDALPANAKHPHAWLKDVPLVLAVEDAFSPGVGSRRKE